MTVGKIKDFPDGTRECTSCGTRLPLEQFDLDRSSTGRRRGQCKPCRSTLMKAWYAANRERQAARQQARRDADPDKARRQDMERYQRNKAKRIALAAEGWHKRRALKMQSPRVAGITKAALRKIHGDACRYCGTTMQFIVCKNAQYVPDQATIEHIVPLSKGGAHDWENVALACRRCNLRKNRRTPDEWEARPAS